MKESELNFLDASPTTLNLLVEDVRTSMYLKTLFNDDTSTIKITPVGGCDGVSGLVRISWEENAQSPHAYGWRDRDFSESNVEKWGKDDVHVFTGLRHEIENYFLDWEAMRSCDRAPQVEVDFRSVAHKIASDMLYAVVCDQVLSELQRGRNCKFPENPSPIKINSKDSALKYVIESDWFKHAPDVTAEICTESYVRQLIEKAVSRFEGDLSSDNWMETFPGKEIFENLCQEVFSGSVSCDDFARSIAEYQRDNNRVPDELADFFKELRHRREQMVSPPVTVAQPLVQSRRLDFANGGCTASFVRDAYKFELIFSLFSDGLSVSRGSNLEMRVEKSAGAIPETLSQWKFMSAGGESTMLVEGDMICARNECGIVAILIESHTKDDGADHVNVTYRIFKG